MKVKDVMTSETLKYCSPGTKLHTAAKTMKEHNCGALPVVDKEKKVLGIVTDRDICLSMAQKQTSPVTLSRTTVSQIMNEKVHTVQSKDDIEAAFKQMRVNKVGRLPVVDKNGKLTGILSLHNLIHGSVVSGEGNFGDVNSGDENLTRTIQAVTDRYITNGSSPKKNSKNVRSDEAS